MRWILALIVVAWCLALGACQGFDAAPLGVLLMREEGGGGASLADSGRRAWDPEHPKKTSNVHSVVWANDVTGTLAIMNVYFRKMERGRWDYHVLLASHARGSEIAAGHLDFDGEGRLQRVTTMTPMYFPGALGRDRSPIELSFGLPTADGGRGVDGLTSFPDGSNVVPLRSSRAGSINVCNVYDSARLPPIAQSVGSARP